MRLIVVLAGLVGLLPAALMTPRVSAESLDATIQILPLECTVNTTADGLNQALSVEPQTCQPKLPGDLQKKVSDSAESSDLPAKIYNAESPVVPEPPKIAADDSWHQVVLSNVVDTLSLGSSVRNGAVWSTGIILVTLAALVACLDAILFDMRLLRVHGRFIKRQYSRLNRVLGLKR